MRKIMLFFALLPMLAVAQNETRQEVVSKRIADAISSGKFYMELSGVVNPNQYMEEGEQSMSHIVMTLRLAQRNGVSMSRFTSDMGSAISNVSLSIDGYSYILDEAKKTYTAQLVEENGMTSNSFGKLIFMRQGSCLLNGVKYHYDVWRAENGHNLTFYYNSKDVTAVDLGVEGLGVMSLLSFDKRIPNDMYFCLTREWKRGSTMGGGMVGTPDVKAMTGIDTDAMIQQALSQVNPDDLPEGIDLKALMGGKGKVDTQKMIQQYVKEEDLPEGMSMNDLMGMMGNVDMSQMMKNLTPEQQRMMQQQGVDLSQMGTMGKEMEMERKKLEAANQQITQAAANAPEPPICSVPWTDSSASEQLATGNDLGAVTLTAQVNTPRTDYVYTNDFSDAPKAVIHRTDLNVTDEGVWLAFDDLSKQIEGMGNDEAHDYILSVNSGMLSAVEAGYITGQMVEYAVATCMIAPQPINYNNTGMLFVKVEDNERALLYFEKAAEMDPENPAILTNIGECFLEKKDYATARRYADKALASSPTFGPALQLHTTLLLQEGKHDEAISALFHCAAYYFSDITAAQFFSLWTQLQAEYAKVQGTHGDFKVPVLDRIFSPKNQELLAKATKAGFNSNGQDSPENAKSFPLTYAPAAIQSTYASLELMEKNNHEANKALGKTVNEIMERTDLKYDLYFSLGMKDVTGALSGMEKKLNEIPQVNGKVDMTSTLNEYVNESYTLLNQAYNKDKSITLTDARQFWCLMMWKLYYELQIYWADGYYITKKEDKGVVVGDCPETYRRYHQVLYENSVYDSLAKEKRDESRKGCAGAGDEKAVLRCILDCEKSYFKWISANTIANHTALQQHYKTSVQPLLEEYWLRMNAMTAYCDNLDMQEYFLTDAMHFINGFWMTGLSRAIQDGRNLEQMYDALVKMAAAFGEKIQKIEQQEAEQREALKKKDATLKNYGEKDSPDFGIGIPTPIGKISFMHSEGETTFAFESAASGKKYSRNMTTGETTTMTTYTTLADEKNQKPSVFEQVKKWATEDSKKNITDVVGREFVTKVGIDRFFPYSENTSRQHARTVDAQGNVTDTYSIQQTSHGFNLGGVSATATKTQIRSGASLRTKNHVTFGFKNFDITIGK